MVVKPKRNMLMLNQTWGRNFFSRMLDGISKRMYGTKKTTSALL